MAEPTLEAQVASLTDATTALLNAVNVSKSTLDGSKNTAVSSAADALESRIGAETAQGLAEDARDDAQLAQTGAETAESNAVAVVTGGTASIDSEAGKIPLADAEGKINADWIPDAERFPSLSGKNGCVLAVNESASAVEWVHPQNTSAELFVLSF